MQYEYGRENRSKFEWLSDVRGSAPETIEHEHIVHGRVDDSILNYIQNNTEKLIKFTLILMRSMNNKNTYVFPLPLLQSVSFVLFPSLSVCSIYSCAFWLACYHLKSGKPIQTDQLLIKQFDSFGCDFGRFNTILVNISLLLCCCWLLVCVFLCTIFNVVLAHILIKFSQNPFIYSSPVSFSFYPVYFSSLAFDKRKFRMK